MIVAALAVPIAAHAQCYAFSSGSAATLVLNVTTLPTPTVSSYGANGGHTYLYTFSSWTGISVTVTIGGTVYTSSSITGDISVSADPGSMFGFGKNTFITAVLDDSGASFSSSINLRKTGTDYFGTGGPLPPVLPGSSSQWDTTGFYMNIQPSSMPSVRYDLTTIAPACTVAPPDKTLGDCAACNSLHGQAIPGQATAAEPVTITSGNVFEKKTDYTTAGPNPLQFTRSYNSMYSANGSFALSMGNWRTPYDKYLHISPATSPTTVIAERADGLMLAFTLSGSTWTPDTDVDYTLTHSGSTWTLTDHNDTVETYSDAGTGEGLLSTIVLRNGYTQTLTYSSGLLSSVTDSYSRSFNFTYTGGLLTNVTNPDSATGITYGYNANGALTTVTYPTTPASTLTYVYGNASLPFVLTGITDENGNTFATWTYDSQGRAASNQMGGTLAANATTFSYGYSLGIGTTIVTNAFGVADTYTYYPLQNVPKISQVSRAATSTTAAATRYISYDTNGFVSRTTDWFGTPTVYTNDSHGDPTTISEAPGYPDARTTTISYGASSGACTTFVRLPCTITTAGLTSTFTYDANGNPLTRTDTDTTTTSIPYSTNGQIRTTTWTWSGTGQMASVQLPRTDVTAKTTFIYTGGTLTQIQDALGHQTNITSYMNGGFPLTIVDPNSVTTTLTYDGRQNLNTSTLHRTAGNLTTTWTLDPALNLTALQLPDASKTTYSYDNAHRLTGVTDLLGNTIAYTLDALGDITQEQAKKSGGTVTYQDNGTFDALGRESQDTNGVSQTTTYTYNLNSMLTSVTPPSSGTTYYGYDEFNRLTARSDPSAGPAVASATYDAHDRVTSIQDKNGNTTAYTYDGFGDRIQTASPDSGTTVAYFNPDRDMTQQIKPGPQTANMTYDANDRLLATSYPSDSTLNVSRTYDQTGHGFGIGRLTSATDQPGTLSLSYDERGNITNESRTVTSVGTLTTATTFDNASRVASITYPSSTLVTYTRDSMGQVSGITAKPPGASSASNVATSIVYQPSIYPGGLGKEPWTLTYGNGITGVYSRDLANRPTTHIDNLTGGGYANYLNYAYYTNSNLLYVQDGVNFTNTQSFNYDALNRLTSSGSAPGGYGSYSWTWDANSNLTSQTINSTATTFAITSGTNQLASMTPAGGTATTVSTSPTGNITTLTQGMTTLLTLTYNQANQIASAASTTSATYKYDLGGLRLEKAISGSYPILYQYSRQGGELLSENDLHSGQTADYIYLDPGRNSVPIGEVNPTSGDLYFMHTDRLGTVDIVTDATQTNVWNALYNPFGDNSVGSVSGTLATQSLRLPGQYFDPETDSNHNGYRDYNGTFTRYLQSDPIGLAGGTNTYQYVGGNPISFTDPNGEQLVEAVNTVINTYGHSTAIVNGLLDTSFPYNNGFVWPWDAPDLLLEQATYVAKTVATNYLCPKQLAVSKGESDVFGGYQLPITDPPPVPDGNIVLPQPFIVQYYSQNPTGTPLLR